MAQNGSRAALAISPLGSGGLLLDMADGAFSDRTQRLVWALASQAAHIEGVHEAVPGMNNLLVSFDALEVAADRLADLLRLAWVRIEPDGTQGKTVEVPVIYGGAAGEDLDEWARHCGLPREEAVRRHAAGRYSVAAIGAMPGFPYLSGLDPALARPRRSVPRAVVPEGAVIIGGTQAGIIPQTAPSGWHILGRTAVKLFDAGAAQPALLRPGDLVRFSIAGIEP